VQPPVYICTVHGPCTFVWANEFENNDDTKMEPAPQPSFDVTAAHYPTCNRITKLVTGWWSIVTHQPFRSGIQPNIRSNNAIIRPCQVSDNLTPCLAQIASDWQRPGNSHRSRDAQASNASVIVNQSHPVFHLTIHPLVSPGCVIPLTRFITTGCSPSLV
jgi:hypothetical protein